ncbi:MAG: hypothetical protein ACYC2E_14215 [Sulfuricella sp.]
MKAIAAVLCLFTISAFAQTLPAKKPAPIAASQLKSVSTVTPTAEQLAQIDSMKQDIEAVKKTIALAEIEDQKYTGGLIKAQIQSRIETVKMTLALLEQKLKALETGAKMTIVIPATKADPALAASLEGEITAQKLKIEQARIEADKYTGGLIKATRENTIATMESTLALIENRALTAKYGLGIAQPALASSSASASGQKLETAKEKPAKASPKNEVVKVQLLNKRYVKEKYQAYIYFDLSFTIANLQKPARAIKGSLNLTDLFDEKIMGISYSIDRSVNPGDTFSEYGTGFKYNQFMTEHTRVNQTELSNMKASYTVESILYQDGTREDF